MKRLSETAPDSEVFQAATSQHSLCDRVEAVTQLLLEGIFHFVFLDFTPS